MKKEVELFDKRFVHFVWDDELEGKKCFVGDGIAELKKRVENNEINAFLEVTEGQNNHPFAVDWTDGSLSDVYQFAYYDPYYEVKWAYYKEGKKIQVKNTDFSDDWIDCYEPFWCKECQYRVKPEDKPRYDEQEKRAEPTFQEELRSLLNRYGMDNECDTPDHILRDYLASCLENYRIITKRNMLWHGWLGLGAELTEEGWKKSVESALKFLMDNRIIKSWQYNGTFHVEGNE